jgi:hypothetical protein
MYTLICVLRYICVQYYIASTMIMIMYTCSKIFILVSVTIVILDCIKIIVLVLLFYIINNLDLISNIMPMLFLVRCSVCNC